MFGCSACGKDANEVSCFSFAVANKKQSSLKAHSEQEKAIFRGRMLIIEKLERELIKEYRLGFLKGDPMFFEIGCRLGWIPSKPNHKYSVLQKIQGARGSD